MKDPNMLDYPMRLDSSVWVLGNPHFNLYLVRGNRASALIEVGISAIVDEVISQLDRLAAIPDYLVLTHPHSDHLTGLPGLVERFPRAVTVVAEGAVEFALHPKAMAAMAHEDRYMAHQLAIWGVQPGRPSLDQIRFPENRVIAGDGDEIDLGGNTLRFMTAEGHSPGNIVVSVPEAGALILSDSMGFHYPRRGFCPLFFTGFETYVTTLDALARLHPRIIGPGHQGPIVGEDVQTAFARTRQITLDVYNRILGMEFEDDDAATRLLFNTYYRDEFTLYSRENIGNCMQLLVRRSKEASGFEPSERNGPSSGLKSG